MPERKWIIVNVEGECDDYGRPLYWSNEEGWTYLAGADTFTTYERYDLNLPLGGEWDILPTTL